MASICINVDSAHSKNKSACSLVMLEFYTEDMWYYVYILKNIDGHQYVGHTFNLHDRLQEHNEGSVDATKNRRPWHIEWFCGFKTEKQAIAFEKHLKGGSGSAFRFKHFASKKGLVLNKIP